MSCMRGRLIFKCDLIVRTGIHIGGGNASIGIGGIDSSVIKTHKGEPYIPGSSIKGKLRSLTELSEGKFDTSEGEVKPCNCGKCQVCKIYGVGANSENKETLPTRIIVRDAFLKKEIAEEMRNKQGDFKELEFLYTESKWENTIDRLSSKANPRVIERVPEGAIFEVEVIYTVYNEEDLDNLRILKEGFELLQDDYLGGNGTRGYGKVEFKNITIIKKTLKHYSNESKDEYESIDKIPVEYINKLKQEFGLK